MGRGCWLVRFSVRRAEHPVAQGRGQAVTCSSLMTESGDVVQGTQGWAQGGSAWFARSRDMAHDVPVVRGAWLEQDIPAVSWLTVLAACSARACAQSSVSPSSDMRGGTMRCFTEPDHCHGHQEPALHSGSSPLWVLTPGPGPYAPEAIRIAA